jgi:hypothetical protein
VTRGRGDEGQAAVEVALVLPLVATLLLLVVQTALIVRDQVLVVHAAREAARAAAVEAGDDAPRRAAMLAGGLEPKRIETEIVSDGSRLAGATVRVEDRRPAGRRADRRSRAPRHRRHARRRVTFGAKRTCKNHRGRGRSHAA